MISYNFLTKSRNKPKGIFWLEFNKSLPICYLASILILFSCDAKERIIYVHNSCEEFEIISDVEYSISSLKAQLEQRGIMVEYTEKSTCGYTFKEGSKTKEITSALTDVDLLLEIEDFFE